MSSYGGFSPYPRRLGGATPVAKTVFDSLAADRGTAINAADSTTTVYVETLAIARSIAATWGTNQRLGNCWVPKAMPVEILGRWEAILNLRPSPKATLDDRRAAVGQVMALVGFPSNSGYLATVLTGALGAAFVAIEHIDPSIAVVNVPDGTYPWGTPNTLTPWSSTAANILIRLQTPTGWSELDFQKAASKVFPLLDPILPAWVTFDWYRAGSAQIPISGGGSATGFTLDDAHNLDNELFNS